MLHPAFLTSATAEKESFQRMLAVSWAESADKETEREVGGLQEELADLEEKLSSQRPVFPLTLGEVGVLKKEKQARLTKLLEEKERIRAVLEALRN